MRKKVSKRGKKSGNAEKGLEMRKNVLKCEKKYQNAPKSLNIRKIVLLKHTSYTYRVTELSGSIMTIYFYLDQ